MKKYTILFFSLITLITFLCAFIIDRYGHKTPALEQYDAIVVAGCKVKKNGTPSLALQARVQKAVALYKKGYANKIIFTGGSRDTRPTEAQAAKDYALSLQAFPQHTLFLEDKSTSTKENAKFAKERYPNVDSIILVSDSYHIFRGERIFIHYFSRVDGVGRTPKFDIRIKGALREIPALIYHRWNGNI